MQPYTARCGRILSRVDAEELHRRLLEAGCLISLRSRCRWRPTTRINSVINSVLASTVPDWVMSLFAVQDGSTAS
jgi:hypothetical protein